MAKRLSIKAKTAILEQMKAGTMTANPQEDLRGFLQDKNHMIISDAAKIAGKNGFKELCEDMAAAFHRLIGGGMKADMGCFAKIAIVRALDQMLYNDDDDVFCRGIKYFQPEPAYGAPNDTAAELRALCALALARLVHHKIYYLLTDLIMDPEPPARTGAVRALVYLGGRESELLLRMKIHAGDDHPDVLSECFSGLAQIDPSNAVPFLAEFLDSMDPVKIEEAAIALGETREIEAFEILCRKREDSFRDEQRRMLLLPMALTRSTEAFNYLIDILENDHVKSAVSALDALLIYRADPKMLERIGQAVKTRKEGSIRERFMEVTSNR